MLDDRTIQSAVTRLVAAATSPGQVILFGSYARGTADEGSDLDLLVIEREIPNKADEYMRLRDALGRLAPGVSASTCCFIRSTSTPSLVGYHDLVVFSVIADDHQHLLGTHRYPLWFDFSIGLVGYGLRPNPTLHCKGFPCVRRHWGQQFQQILTQENLLGF